MPKKSSHAALPLTPSRRLNKMAAKPLTGTSSHHKLLKSINKLCKFWRAIIVIKIGQMTLCWFIASSGMSFGWLRPNGLSQPKDIQASAINHHKAIYPILIPITVNTPYHHCLSLPSWQCHVLFTTPNVYRQCWVLYWQCTPLSTGGWYETLRSPF